LDRDRVSISATPPRSRELHAPERDVRTGRLGHFDRENKGSDAQHSTLARPHRQRVTRTRVGVGAVAAGIAAAGIGVLAFVGGDDDRPSGAAPPGAAPSIGSSPPADNDLDQTPVVGTDGDGISSVAEPAPSLATEATASPSAAPPRVEASVPPTAVSTTAPTTTTTTSPPSGAGTYAAVATFDSFDVTQTPSPPGFPPRAPAEAMGYPGAGDTDDQPLRIRLVGSCDGVGPCRLRYGSPRNGVLDSRASFFSFTDLVLEPTGSGYRGRRSEPVPGKFASCQEVITTYSQELRMRRTDRGWTGRASGGNSYSSHVNIYQSADEQGFIVCDSFVFRSTFTLTGPR
jgi:hypothetical protein